jgi:signal transduction histidine kinase
MYTLFIAGLYFIGTPLLYAERLQVCAGPDCAPGQITAANAQALHLIGLSPSFYSLCITVIPLLIPLAGFLVTTLIAWNRAHDPMALLTVFLIGACTAGSTDVLKALAATYPDLHWPIAVLFFIPTAGLIPWTAIFPDGRFVPRWSRWLVLPSVAVSLLIFLPASDISQTILALWWPVIITTALGLLVYRYRWYADPVQQQQLRWPTYGTAITVLVQLSVFILGLLFPVVSQPGTLEYLLAQTMIVLSLTLLMLCYGVAIFHYRLLNIELIINRTLVYSALMALMIGLYALIAGLLSAIFQGQGNFIVALVATGVVTIVFSPLRDRLQRGINRLMYGDRDEPYRVVSRLGQRLEAAFEPADVLPAIVQTVGESLKIPYVAIALTLDDWRSELEEPENKENHGPVSVNRLPAVDLSAVAASYGQPPQRQSLINNLHLVYQGEVVGQLFVSPRPGEASLSAADRRLLADLAQQAGVAVHGVRLMTDLRYLTHDLQRSRERLVLAREEERRRLRRDLHDDLAPNLAGLALTTSTISDLISTDPAKAQVLATDLNKAIRAAVGDIRRLVYDLRPPALDELGLVAAIRERAAQYNHHHGSAGSLQVIVEAGAPLPCLPAAVEVAAYRITQEALMNVVRHAHARTCQIRLSVNDPMTAHNRRQAGGHFPAPVTAQQPAAAMLSLEIIDDGIGLAESYSPGVGLRSMKERAAELGGVCTIESGLKSGTFVFVSLPILKDCS